MTAKPCVSAIAIFLNEEQFLEEAIQSVLSQTFANWELLLVDDGSTDRSPEIARRYSERDPGRVRLLAHEGRANLGMSASRNLGIRNSRGKYCAFLDADDVWLPNKLARQLAILESEPDAAMVWGPAGFWFSWTGDSADLQRDFVAPPPVVADRLIRPPGMLGFCLQEASPAVPSGFLVRREVLERVGGFEEHFRGTYEVYEDRGFLAKIYLNESVFVSSECLFRYRVHPKSCAFVAIKAGHYHLARRAFMTWLEGYMTRQGVQDGASWQALREAQWPYRHPLLHWMARAGRVLLERLSRVAGWFALSAVKLRIMLIEHRTGSLTADPNPILVPGRLKERFPLVGATTLTWTCDGADTIEVRVGAPNGPLLSRSAPSGSATTGHWVSDGMLFYLQDVSSGKALSRRNTLDTVRIVVRDLDKAKSTRILRGK